MKKIDLLVRGSMAVLVAAFVMRPVVVAVHNGPLFSGARSVSPQVSDTVPVGQLTAAKTAFHNIPKESKDFTTPAPRFTRSRAPATGNRLLNPAAASDRVFPRSFLILLI